MATGTKFHIPKPENEPTLGYEPGSPERDELKQRIAEMKATKLDIPLIIGGKEVRTGNTRKSFAPHNHELILANYHNAGPEEASAAIDAALDAENKWSTTPWYDRAAIFLKAAELLAGPYRQTVNAASMLDQSKNIYQAEIDGANELVDFLRFNAYYMQEIYRMQVNSTRGEWDRLEYRPLEGFVFAVCPFNFISIIGNLPTAPAMMGNVVVWKPPSRAVYVAYHLMKIFMEAGLAKGVINFIPGPGSRIGDAVINNPNLAGIHFTGSTPTFITLWKQVAENIEKYRNYPRLVGETGGKDFIFVHKSAKIDELVAALVRGAFEYQGQKCSAASRAYIPQSLWPDVRKQLLDDIQRIKMGDVEDFTNFMNAVIDKAAFNSITKYIDFAKESDELEILSGGSANPSTGYFIEPTVVLTSNPKSKLMKEEIFGPILTLYVYEDDEYEKTLHLCDETSPYGLTGSIFATDRDAIVKASSILRYAAGNFYINDKPTGAVVGRQPFGGARRSGTNDKAGSILNLLRWLSPRSIKENFVPPKDFVYDYMSES